MNIKNWRKDGPGMALSFEVTRVKVRPDSFFTDPGAKHFYVTINHDGHPECPVFCMFFSQGSAHTKGPTSWDILGCLKLDASCAGVSFEDFCDELGYDPDSRQAYRTWEAVERQIGELKKCFGSVLWQSFIETEGE